MIQAVCVERGGHCQGGVAIINRKLVLVLALVALALLCAVACIMVLNVPREEHVATIELPSGDRIIIKFCYYRHDFLSAFIPTSGVMKYDIYSGESRSSGQLGVSYDIPEDVRLTHEIQGERRVKIEEGLKRESWIFEGDSSGKYKIIGSYRQPQVIN